MKLSAAAVSLDDYMQSRRVLVDAALDSWLPRAPDCPEPLAAAMHYAVFPGGKRLRPMLVLFAAEACGGTAEQAMPAACAAELVHCYSLVHDDLPAMDDDDLRRGRPTCHKVFGEALAILAGDGLLTSAFEILARYSATPELGAKLCHQLAQAAGPRGMVGGQADDMAAEQLTGSDPITLDRLQSIHARKTGALFRCCLRLGALAAGAVENVVALLDRYGQRIGLAFQITDDLLDACGHETATGKRVGKDDGRGKWTYPGILGVDQSRRLAQQFCQEACMILEPLRMNAERLRTLARSIVERDR